MTIATPRPAHRLERLRAWMDDERIDCTVVFGSDNVNHLCGYWRYFGGPSALVIGRDGERTLVVMLDEAPDRGETVGRGPGARVRRARVRHRPRPGRRTHREARRRPGGDAGHAHRCRLRDPRLRGPPQCGSALCLRRRRTGAPQDQAGQGLGRAREDQRRLSALLARPGGRRRRCRARRERDRALHRSPVNGTDSVRGPDRVRLRPPLGLEHGRRLLSDPRRRYAQRWRQAIP